MKKYVFAAALLSVTLTLARAESVIAITAGNQLISFDSAAPGTIVTTASVIGLPVGDAVQGIDIRPADGHLYALTDRGGLYRLNVTTGVAAFVAALSADPTDATNPFTSLSGTSFGIDFNPVVDRLRVVSNAGQNLRVNPDTGDVTTDTPLNPGNPTVGGAAYTNNFAGATSTTLYVLNAQSNTLEIQNPPNDGTLTVVGPLGGDAPGLLGFDISPGSGVAYGAANIGALPNLYTIDLATGDATLAGQIGTDSDPVTGIAVARPTVLLNISTRGRVGIGEDVLIAGFIARGGAPSRLIARGIGPSLSSSGITAPLQDPVIRVFDSNGNLFGSNDDWRSSSQEAEIMATGLAPTNDAEAALIGFVAPGAYTVELSGKNSTMGVGLVEIYQL